MIILLVVTVDIDIYGGDIGVRIFLLAAGAKGRGSGATLAAGPPVLQGVVRDSQAEALRLCTGMMFVMCVHEIFSMNKQASGSKRGHVV